MTVKRLIEELKLCDPESEVMITGLYGSETVEFDVIERKLEYGDEKVCILSSDICSG